MRMFLHLIGIALISFVLSLNTSRVFPINDISVFITIIGLIYGLIAAFTINNSWERFSKIRDAIAQETSSMINMHIILKNTSTSSSVKKFADQVIQYNKEVIDTQWKNYWLNDQAHEKFMGIFDIIASQKKYTKDPLYDQCFEEFRQASTARTHQLVLSQSRISGFQWILVIFLSAILVGSVAFLKMPSGSLTLLISTVMVAAIILILVVIYELDSMKLAEWEVSIGPFNKVIKTLGGKEYYPKDLKL